MKQRKLEWRDGVPAPVDQLLASRYSKLLQWGSVLTRGDAGKAEEIVQELCLYFTLTQPDLTSVANLNGYLYTSLRHIYLSGLARASREALRFVSIAEFDSFDSALAGNPADDPLEKQNDLRRICGYAVWRKESSKSAGYFILHFFHGYGRREIAELACLPISAIYNKLKIARSEVMSYLEAPGKLRVVNRDLPPQPNLSWSLLPAPQLFSELRNTILRARRSNCLEEEQLMAHYRAAFPTPISCSLLAHIVSCERCLSLVDRHFRRPTLHDREPLDCFGTSSDGAGGSEDRPGDGDQNAQKAMQAVRMRWGKIREHRPRTLSIAVNGHIIAFHDVRAEHSKLSARIDPPESAKFVEVFSEQDVRLALLSIGELPPEGSPVRTQRVELSDDRWLELSLSFDGLGLNGQVAYFDPALATQAVEEDQEESPAAKPVSDTAAPRRSQLNAAFRHLLAAMTPSSTFAWSLILVVLLGTAGYFAYRHQSQPTNAAQIAMQILDKSIKAETETLDGQTEHQVLRVEELSSNGKVLEQGTVDLWKDGNGDRYVRRLYDPQHRMLAAEWRNKGGEHSSHRNPAGKSGPAVDHPLVLDQFWDQDLSAQAFRTLAGKDLRMQPVKAGYELTADAPRAIHNWYRRHWCSIGASNPFAPACVSAQEATFMSFALCKPAMNANHALWFQTRSSILHLLQPYAMCIRRASIRAPLPAESVPLLAELQIAVLYRLNRLGADTGEPIEVERTGDGRIRVSGAIAGDALRQRVSSQLQALPNHQLLDLKLFSPHALRRAAPTPQAAATRVFEIDQAKSAADPTLRKYFQGQGLSGEPLESAVVAFSHDALEHAQSALQHAYALDRLGRALSATELRSVSLASQQQWTEMLNQHASDLQQQFLALRGQLAKLSAPAAATPEDAEPIRSHREPWAVQPGSRPALAVSPGIKPPGQHRLRVGYIRGRSSQPG